MPGKIFGCALLIAALLACNAAAAVEGSATISFTGSSTLHDFSGTAPSVDFILAPGPGDHWSADVAVPVAGMETGNGWRDDNMRAMFDVEHFPHIRAAFRDLDPEQVHRRAALPFLLTIRDVSRQTTAAVEHWQQDGDQLSFDVTFPVSLKAFNLKAPRALLFVSVADAVHVTVHVVLKRA